jgi:hypothetical protein
MKQLITNNLATWTTAPKGIKKLRELIFVKMLGYAITNPTYKLQPTLQRDKKPIRN